MPRPLGIAQDAFSPSLLSGPHHLFRAEWLQYLDIQRLNGAKEHRSHVLNHDLTTALFQKMQQKLFTLPHQRSITVPFHIGGPPIDELYFPAYPAGTEQLNMLSTSGAESKVFDWGHWPARLTRKLSVRPCCDDRPLPALIHRVCCVELGSMTMPLSCNQIHGWEIRRAVANEPKSVANASDVGGFGHFREGLHLRVLSPVKDTD